MKGQLSAALARKHNITHWPISERKDRDSVCSRVRSFQVSIAPDQWSESCTSNECSLHQLSPYIGKLKSSIVIDLLSTYSKPGDLVADPFSGSGTVPLEAARLKRNVFAADISPYAKVLTLGKLTAPHSLELAMKQAEDVLYLARNMQPPDLRKVPSWVRQFFHPKTLKEAINFAAICRKLENNFLLSCLLGILHHQRQGFLSYPSSHLVPYLRDKKFPRRDFPDLYSYRALGPRLRDKLKRAYKRFSPEGMSRIFSFTSSSIEEVKFPRVVDCVITSPPYMNTLDYGRDNRLRLWFIRGGKFEVAEDNLATSVTGFITGIKALARKAESSLIPGGACILVVGEKVKRTYKNHPSSVVAEIFDNYAPSLRPEKVILDMIPDIRRSRREFRGTKEEHILIYKKGVR